MSWTPSVNKAPTDKIPNEALKSTQKSEERRLEPNEKVEPKPEILKDVEAKNPEFGGKFNCCLSVFRLFVYLFIMV